MGMLVALTLIHYELYHEKEQKQGEEIDARKIDFMGMIGGHAQYLKKGSKVQILVKKRTFSWKK